MLHVLYEIVVVKCVCRMIVLNHRHSKLWLRRHCPNWLSVCLCMDVFE